MVFPDPAGILTGEDVLAAVRDMPRWSDVTFSRETLARFGADTAVPAYEAAGWTGGDSPAYRALCSSTYVRTADGWRLAQHQQTPL